jgi:uncharacterized protein
VVGSTAFFIVHGSRQNAKQAECRMLHSTNMSDVSKIFYLEVIDATFSIDGVIGAFTFTMSVLLILIGNGIGAFAVRELTVRNVDRIKKYLYLKNGAMYSIFFLGTAITLDSFGVYIPFWVSPIITFGVVGFFLIKSMGRAPRHRTWKRARPDTIFSDQSRSRAGPVPFQQGFVLFSGSRVFWPRSITQRPDRAGK